MVLIGMARDFSATLPAELGAVLCREEEFGFFVFGGSDIVTRFEAGRVHLDAKVGIHRIAKTIPPRSMCPLAL